MGGAAAAVMTRRYLPLRYSAHRGLVHSYWTRSTVRASDQCFSSE
jgi:hypothetical protein